MRRGSVDSPSCAAGQLLRGSRVAVWWSHDEAWYRVRPAKPQAWFATPVGVQDGASGCWLRNVHSSTPCLQWQQIAQWGLHGRGQLQTATLTRPSPCRESSSSTTPTTSATRLSTMTSWRSGCRCRATRSGPCCRAPGPPPACCSQLSLRQLLRSRHLITRPCPGLLAAPRSMWRQCVALATSTSLPLRCGTGCLLSPLAPQGKYRQLQCVASTACMGCAEACSMCCSTLTASPARGLQLTPSGRARPWRPPPLGQRCHLERTLLAGASPSPAQVVYVSWEQGRCS